MTGSPFASRWEHRPLRSARTGVRGLSHPDVGLLRFGCETVELTDQEYQHLVVYLPADTATASGLDRLEGRLPVVLRSVSG